ncbi:MAG: hypothetical protein ACRD1G_14490, partial [Acidimicrobiales bacterium]
MVEAIIHAREEHCRTGRIDVERLRPFLEAVIGDGIVGPVEAPLSVDIQLDMILRTAQVEAHLMSYTDAHLETAREVCRAALDEYRVARPTYAMRRDVGALFADWSTDKEMAQSGQMLVTALGALVESALTSPDAMVPAPARPLINAAPAAASPVAMSGMWNKWLRGRAQVDELRRLLARLASAEPEPPFTQIHRQIDVEAGALVFTVGELPD